MKQALQILVLYFLTISCSSTDETIEKDDQTHEEVSEVDNETTEQNDTTSSKLIESLSFDNEKGIDSLFYDLTNKIILKKKYLDVDQLGYSTHYKYDSAHNLIKIYRVHSSSNIPSEEVNYTYYANGNLKSRNYINSTSNKTDYLEYADHTVFLNRNKDTEVKINLDSSNRIVSAERKNNADQFYIFKEFIYTNSNITEIKVTDNTQNSISYFFEYDDKNNPFIVFDHILPNDLSIKKIEAIILHSNYPFITIGDDDNYFGFLNKNNVISCSGHSSSNYNYSYDSDNYPEKITYEFLFNKNSLIITYH